VRREVGRNSHGAMPGRRNMDLGHDFLNVVYLYGVLTEDYREEDQ
jgi:hypothetical protein